LGVGYNMQGAKSLSRNEPRFVPWVRAGKIIDVEWVAIRDGVFGSEGHYGAD